MNMIPNELEKLPKRNRPKNSILDVLDEPSPDHRETLWGPDFRSFIPSPIPNPSYAADEIVKSLGANNLENSAAPQRSSYCTFWVIVIVASAILIAAGIIVPLVVLNNVRAASHANDVASTDRKTDGGLQSYLPTLPNVIIPQKSDIRDIKVTKEPDALQTIKENGENDHDVKAAVFPENSKDKTPSSKNFISTGLGKGIAAGLGMGVAAVIRKVVKKKESSSKTSNKLRNRNKQSENLMGAFHKKTVDRIKDKAAHAKKIATLTNLLIKNKKKPAFGKWKTHNKESTVVENKGKNAAIKKHVIEEVKDLKESNVKTDQNKATLFSGVGATVAIALPDVKIDFTDESWDMKKFWSLLDLKVM